MRMPISRLPNPSSAQVERHEGRADEIDRNAGDRGEPDYQEVVGAPNQGQRSAVGPCKCSGSPRLGMGPERRAHQGHADEDGNGRQDPGRCETGAIAETPGQVSHQGGREQQSRALYDRAPGLHLVGGPN